MRPRELVRDLAQARQLDGLTPADLVILWDIADRADRTGRSFESAQALADRYGWHYWTVRRSIRRIEATGVIRVEDRPGRSPIYRFPTGEVIHNPAPISAGLGKGDPAPMSRDPAPMSREPRADERGELLELQIEPRCAHRWRSTVTGLCPRCEEEEEEGDDTTRTADTG